MGVLDRDANEIHGRIVYFGPEGAGKTANLECLARKLKKEHRGDLKVIEGEHGSYEHLPVTLGEVKGIKTSMDIYAVPGGDDHASARERLLEDADGIVFVADLRPDSHEATLQSFEELQSQLNAQGRSLDDVPLVIQYNHRDNADENAVEDLHRRLGVGKAVFFECVASKGKGVLQTLTALSKQVLAAIRGQAEQAASPLSIEAPHEALPLDDQPDPSNEETALDAQFDLDVDVVDPDELVPLDPPATRPADLSLASAGSPSIDGGDLVIPVALVDERSGETIDLTLRLTLSAR